MRSPPLPRWTARRCRRALLTLLIPVISVWSPEVGSAQVEPGSAAGWDDSEVRELLDRARTRRLEPIHESTLEGYSARADGRILFFVERDDGGDPFPLRVDQVSVDLYWSPPDRARQVVRAQRNEELFPLLEDFDYYLDRLSIIQNGFGDEITVGEGRDVRAVPHPLGVRSGDWYSFRLRDRLELSLPGLQLPMVVREVEVRPRDPDRPGFIGTVLLDETTAAIVRLDFTFTPSSYVDPRNDGIIFSLEHALWENRFWLPYRQTVRVRREIPELDLPVGTVIQAELEVRDYEFGPVPTSEVPGQAGMVVELPSDGLGDTTRFERPLREELLGSGLAIGDPRAIETEAIRELRAQALSGLPGWRLGGNVSRDFVRANRVEGVVTGAGLAWRLPGGMMASASAGFAWGSEDPVGGIALRRAVGPGGGSLELELGWDRPRDVGVGPASPGILNSLAALVSGTDWTDPFPVRGGTLRYRRPGVVPLQVALTAEDHRDREPAWDRSPVGDSHYRALIPVSPGFAATFEVGIEPTWVGERGRFEMDLSVEGGSFEGDRFGRVLGAIDGIRPIGDGRWLAAVRVQGGAVGGDAPPQFSWYLGGRGTLPGYGFRSWVGDGFALARLRVSRELVRPWLDLSGTLGTGRSAGGSSPPLTVVGIGPTGGWRSFTGAGVALLGGAVRLDYYRALGGPGDEWVISIDPRLPGL